MNINGPRFLAMFVSLHGNVVHTFLVFIHDSPLQDSGLALPAHFHNFSTSHQPSKTVKSTILKSSTMIISDDANRQEGRLHPM